MAFNPILDAEIEVGDPITQDLMQKIKDNQSYFNGLVGQFNTLDLVNGSFEEDSDADDTPDNWTWTAHPGGSKAVNNGGSHGAKYFSITAPSGGTNGGGYLDSDYYPMSDAARGATLSWYLNSNAATIGIKVTVRAYTFAKAFISEYDIFASTSGAPSFWTRYFAHLGVNSLPATTRFIRIRLEAGTIGPGVAGTVDFDGVSMREPMPATWRITSNWSATPVTTTSNAYSTLTTTGFTPAHTNNRIGGECTFVVSGYLRLKCADQNEIGYARVTHTGSSANSNEMWSAQNAYGSADVTEQIWHWTLEVDCDYSASYTMNLQAKNSDNIVTITLTEPDMNDLTIHIAENF